MVAARRRTAGNGNDHAAAQGLHSRLKTLRGNIGALQDDVLGLAGAAGDAALGAANEHVSSAMDVAGRQARVVSESVEAWGNDNMKSIGKAVRAQPFTACAMMLGVGALLGFFLRR